MKRYLPLILTLLLLSGCWGRRMEKSLPVVTETPEVETDLETTVIPSPSPEILPEPTQEPDSVTSPEPVPVTTPEPELPGEALALLTLADTDRVLDKAVGDLNGDGAEDWAVVVEHLEGVDPESFYRDAPRTLTILLDDGKGGYILGQTNDRLIRRASQGGVNGDPYMGIFIENGELHYGTYGGSALRWSEGYTFHWVGDGLELKSFGSGRFWVYNNQPTYELYDFTTGEYTEKFNPHGEEGEGLVIWRQAFSAAPPRLEEMKGADEAGESWVELPPLPSPGGYMSAPPLQSPETLLDKAKEDYHPDMWRVDIPWTEETRANYSAALGYPVPGYYYTNGEGDLYYYRVEVQGEAQKPHMHYIWYKGKNNSENWEDYEIYWYLDETGEEWGTEN